MQTRRELLGAGGAGCAAALLAACGEDDRERRGASREELRARDRKLLGSALDMENTVIAAYEAGLPLLRGSALASGRAIAAHEREHAERLRDLIEGLGGRPNPARTAEEYARAFPRLRRQRDVLRFAVDLENAAVRLYLESLPKLTDPRLRQAAAAIATSEAEHAAVLRGALGRPQVPDAFVTGRSQTA